MFLPNFEIQRIGWRRVVWEKYCWAMSPIPRRICTHARTRWCARLQIHTHTHTHANRHVRIKLKNKVPKPSETRISPPQKSKNSQPDNNFQDVQSQNFHKTLPPGPIETIKRHVSLFRQICQMALMAKCLIVTAVDKYFRTLPILAAAVSNLNQFGNKRKQQIFIRSSK